MRKIIKRLYLGFRVQLRMIRLRLMLLKEPEDAKDPKEMLEEIKRHSNLT